MAKKVTRIKASDSARNEETDVAQITRNKVAKVDKKLENKKAKDLRAKEKAEKKATSGEKKVFILFRPFVAFFRYLRDSWREIRQVRWPNRKATWKMVLAVFVYTGLFILMISLLDLFFTWLFSLIIK